MNTKREYIKDNWSPYLCSAVTDVRYYIDFLRDLISCMGTSDNADVMNRLRGIRNVLNELNYEKRKIWNVEEVMHVYHRTLIEVVEQIKSEQDYNTLMYVFFKDMGFENIIGNNFMDNVEDLDFNDLLFDDCNEELRSESDASYNITLALLQTIHYYILNSIGLDKCCDVDCTFVFDNVQFIVANSRVRRTVISEFNKIIQRTTFPSIIKEEWLNSFKSLTKIISTTNDYTINIKKEDIVNVTTLLSVTYNLDVNKDIIHADMRRLRKEVRSVNAILTCIQSDDSVFVVDFERFMVDICRLLNTYMTYGLIRKKIV